MKTALRLLAAAAIFGLLVFAFGYFDEELSDERRWGGLALIVASLAIAWPALQRLIEDWPRLKPQYNVDATFALLGLSLAMLVIACMMGGRFAAKFAPLSNPVTPTMNPPVSS